MCCDKRQIALQAVARLAPILTTTTTIRPAAASAAAVTDHEHSAAAAAASVAVVIRHPPNGGGGGGLGVLLSEAISKMTPQEGASLDQFLSQARKAGIGERKNEIATRSRDC
jgi:hypothetical protein